MGQYVPPHLKGQSQETPKTLSDLMTENPKPEEMSYSDYLRSLLAISSRVAGPWAGAVIGGGIGATGGAAAGVPAGGVGAVPGAIAGGVAGSSIGGGIGGGVGETIAELLESYNKDNDPRGLMDRLHDINLGRVGVATGVGAIPGAWAVRTGKPLASAVVGGGIGYGSTALNKLAEGETPEKSFNPTEWGKWDLLGPGLGFGLGGLLGKYTGKPKVTPEAPSTYEVEPTIRPGGTTLFGGKITEGAKGKKTLAGAKTRGAGSVKAIPTEGVIPITPTELPTEPLPRTPEEIAADIARVQELEANDIPLNGGATPIMGTPAKASARVFRLVTKDEAAKTRLEDQFGNADAKANVKAADAEVKAATQAEKDALKSNKTDTAEEMRDQKNLNDTLEWLDKKRNADATQDARNLNARDKFLTGVEDQTNQETAQAIKDREAGWAQEAKNLNEGDKYVENALKARQLELKTQAEQEAIQLAKAKLTGEPSQSVTQRIQAPNPDGPGTESLNTRLNPPKPEIDPDTGLPKDTPPLTGGEPILPEEPMSRARAERTVFTTEKEANRVAIATRATGVHKMGNGRYRLSYDGGPLLEPEPPTVTTPPSGTPPKPTGGVGKAMAKAAEKGRPFNQLSTKDQQDLLPILQEALDKGFSGDIETLGDELAGRLGALKDGRDLAADSGGTAEELTKAIAKLGGISETAETANKGEIRALRETFGKRAGRIFNNKNGSSLDTIVEGLKQNGKFAHLNTINDLLGHLDKASRAERQGVLDELRSGLGENWWKSAPDVEVSDFTGGAPAHTIEVPPPATEPPAATANDDPNDALDELSKFFQNPEGPKAPESEPALPGIAPQNVGEAVPPVAELPFALDREAAQPGKPPVEPTLFDQASPTEPTAPALQDKIAFAKANFSDEANAQLDELGAKYRAATDEKIKRAIGAQMSEIHRAEQARLAKGGAPEAPAPTLSKAMADAEAARAALPPVKDPVQTGDPTSDALAKMSPAEQDKYFADLTKKLQAERPKGGSTVSSLGAGQFGNVLKIAAENPKLTGGLVGGAAGALSDPDDPLKGAMLGAAAGATASALGAAAISKIRTTPGASSNEIGSVASKIEDAARTFYHMIPDYQRFSLLSHGINLPINMWVGPYGSAFMAGIEHTLAGDPRGPKLIKLLLTYDKNFLERWNTKITTGEASQAIANAESRAEGLGHTGPESFRRITSGPGIGMTAGDMAARDVLIEAGFSEEEARRITLTSDPGSAIGQGIAKGKKGAMTPGGKKSPLTNIMLPFYRTSVNQLEQGMERLPVLGMIYQKFAKDIPDSTRMQIAQQISGLGVSGASYMLGTVVPESDARYVNKFINNFGGQYGAIASLAFAMGQASSNDKSVMGAISKNLTQSVPLPTLEPITDLLSGRSPIKIIPGIFDPNEAGSLPAYGMMTYDALKPAAPPPKAYVPPHLRPK